MNKRFSWIVGIFSVGLTLAFATGCSRQQPVAMAPPTQPQQTMAPPMQGGGASASAQNGSVYNWTDVPQGQQVPINRAVFDQGGYQLFAQSGETIVVPFQNQNLYAMKFGRSNGGMYFVNDGQAPTLFVPNGGGLENASAQGARWYPFPQNYAYTGPVYVGLAPSWTDFVGMGWYPGMSYYGGYWGMHPWGYGGYGYRPMVGLNINIGGHPYYGWNSYHNYYRSNPAPYRVRTMYNNYSSFRSGGGGFGRRSGSSFGGSTGSYGGSFGRRSTGSFGGASAGNNNFSTAPNRPRSSFGGGSSGFGSSGGGRSSTGSFGSSSGSSGFGGSFGSGRRSTFGGGGSSSFGGSRPSSGGSLFGGGRSSGGSFGGGGRSSFGGGGGFGRRR